MVWGYTGFWLKEVYGRGIAVGGVQGYLAHQKLPPSYDHRRALDIGLLQGPRKRTFLIMSEVPL